MGVVAQAAPVPFVRFLMIAAPMLAAGCGGTTVVNPASSLLDAGDATASGSSIVDRGALDGDVADSAVGSDGSALDASYPLCTNGTCGPGLVCQYPMADGCNAKGVCVPFKSCGGAGKQPTYCACDGGGVLGTCDVPGYVAGPVQSFFNVDGGAWTWGARCVACQSGGPCTCAEPSAGCGSVPICTVVDAGASVDAGDGTVVTCPAQ